MFTLQKYITTICALQKVRIEDLSKDNPIIYEGLNQDIYNTLTDYQTYTMTVDFVHTDNDTLVIDVY